MMQFGFLGAGLRVLVSN